MAAQHGNVIAFNTGDVARIVRRDHSEILIPGGTITNVAADADRVIVTDTTGDLVVYNGLNPTLPSVSTITRPSGTFRGQAQGISPDDGSLWAGVIDGANNITRRWDGSSWTRHPASGNGDTNPSQFFHYGVAGGFLYCWGGGNGPGLVKQRTAGGTVTTVWDGNAAVSTLAGTAVTGTAYGVTQAGGETFVVYRAAGSNHPSWSGIYKVTSSTTATGPIQFSGYDTVLAVVTDTEDGLWAQANHTATSTLHLIRFDDTGTVIDAWAPSFTMEPYGMFRGPRLGPYPIVSRLWQGKSVIGAGGGLT